MCSTESKGQRVGRKVEKLRSHLHTAAPRPSHGLLVHLSCLTASFCLFWLWEHLWFQMVSAPMRVPLSVLAHMFWLVLFRFAISSLARQMQSDSLAKIFFELLNYLLTLIQIGTCSLSLITCDHGWFKSNLPFEFKTQTEMTATTKLATLFVSSRPDERSTGHERAFLQRKRDCLELSLPV